jgi:uncharacterized protein YjbI with pentapeptide repeats
MFSENPRFIVEIRNSGYSSPEGVNYPKTAVMTYLSHEGHHESVMTYGYLDEQEIYKMIDKGESLCLDYCYIERFSLNDYRTQRELSKKQPVSITDFSARHAFFDSKESIDLSFAEFSGTEVNFEGAVFSRSAIVLHSARFNNFGLNFSYVKIAGGDLDFTNIIIEKGNVNFKNSDFGPGAVNFHDTELGTGDIDFTNTMFGDGDVSFVNTRFGDGDVSFKVAVFGTGKVDFHYAKFAGGDISFERTEFGEGRKDFRTVEFGTGRVNFNRAIFGNGDVSFEASQLKSGKISFKRSEFGSGRIDFELGEYEDVEASFERAVFGNGSVSFHNSKFKTLCLSSCHFNNYLDLRLASCEYIDLSDTIVRDIIDIKPYAFDIKVNMINFSGMRLIGRLFIDWETNHVQSLIMSQQDTTKRIKAEQFRTLKENFHNTGQYNDEDKAYVEFKRLESKAILEESLQKNPFSALWMYPLFGFKLVVFDWAGLYATNPVRVIISMLVTYTFYSFLIMFMVLFKLGDVITSVVDADKLSLPVKTFYYCVVTFLTIGYGDFYPTGHIRWLAGIIGFTGLFLMSYFTVAFVRKILR